MGYVERKRIVFFALPLSFTVYYVGEDILTIKSGLFKTVENDCYMYKVQDVQHEASLLERIFGLGTIVCYTGDTTHPKLIIRHIRHSREVKNYILKASEEARLRRRTVNMLNIGSGDMEDVDALDE